MYSSSSFIDILPGTSLIGCFARRLLTIQRRDRSLEGATDRLVRSEEGANLRSLQAVSLYILLEFLIRLTASSAAEFVSLKALPRLFQLSDLPLSQPSTVRSSTLSLLWYCLSRSWL